MDAIAKLQKYMQTREAQKKSSEAKDKAWTQFVNQFPNADVTQFVSQVSIDENNNFSAEVFFKASPDLLQSVFGSDRKYWSQKMKTALGLDGAYGFPYQLSPLKTKLQLPIPTVDLQNRRLALQKYLTKRTESMQLQTNFLSQNFVTYFNKPG